MRGAGDAESGVPATRQKMTIRARPATTASAAARGCVSASRLSAITNPSSERLRAQFENGSGVVFAIARVPALARWLLDANAAPAIAAANRVRPNVLMRSTDRKPATSVSA